ncbi:protein TRANSPARENT TESTA 9-like [Impatiens glandulifera]|uniref:protein TRANSPARENT TESTA 9-like n=1 Tax=Impatiens glandulifera TaxID=253017 RepID=UPI001FB0E5BE|nr:protein TRANSPARENT TESTA 9-like [Impatiens glandulifera]
MWLSFWRTIDRFSLLHFKYVTNELRRIKVVHEFNKDVVIELLQSIVEIVTYGDRHDPAIFECFMEYQVLGEFVRILKNSRNASLEAPLLQYLSIMIQNMDTDNAVFYCLSNGYINTIITHQFEFERGDLASYYVSFLRAVSSKLNTDTLCLLVKVHEDAIVSFPLYTEAIKFAYHKENMIQTAIRAITLNIYNVGDDMLYQFVTAHPVANYFSDLVLTIHKRCLHLDGIPDTGDTCTNDHTGKLQLECDTIMDDLYYLKDILSVGEPRLSKMVTQNLISFLVLPIMLHTLYSDQSNGLTLSPITSLYVLTCLVQVVEGKDMVNFVASSVIHASLSSVMLELLEEVTDVGICPTSSTCEKDYHQPEILDDFRKSYLFGWMKEYIPSNSRFLKSNDFDAQKERSGLLGYIFSDDHGLLLTALMLLLVLAESKDTEFKLATMIGVSRATTGMQQTNHLSPSTMMDQSIFLKHMPEILNALLNILASQPPPSVLIQWHTGWFLRKMLFFHKNQLSDVSSHLFNVSFERSCKSLQEELNGSWFDHIPDIFKTEWTSCKNALEEPTQSKDPFLLMELGGQKHSSSGNGGDITPALPWQRMINAVKVLVLHLQLKPFIFGGDPFENPLVNFKTNSLAVSGRKYVSDLSSASFGSEIALGSGIPCKISFSKVGSRDIFVLPVARGMSGKLFLVEKHPLHSKRGVVIAIAPLAGLNPKADEKHRTWLHLQIREFEPVIPLGKNKRDTQASSSSIDEQDGRWTLGFSDANACEAARLSICEEISRQRSCVETLLAPFLLQQCSPDHTK